MAELPSRQCYNIRVHAAHDWVDGINTKHCGGVEGTPPDFDRFQNKQHCENQEPHQAHDWADPIPQWRHCPGVTAEEHITRMPEKRCDKTVMHAGHKYSDDRGLNYSWCPGLTHEEYIKLTMPSGTEKWVPEEKRCARPHTHDSHRWTPDAGKTYYQCKGRTSEEPEDSPPAWSYHVEPRNDEWYYVTKKYAGKVEGGKLIASYKSAYYARMVADILNGGVLLGFEVEI